MPTDAAPRLDESLRPLLAEARTYFRELPRLLAEGHGGRCALIRGDEVVSLWDSFADAYQAGRERFGLTPFLAQPIDPGDLARPLPPELAPAPREAV